MQKHPSAICVQKFDDSFNPAIHITYRISLRSSSSLEPRDPSLRGVDIGFMRGALGTKHGFVIKWYCGKSRKNPGDRGKQNPKVSVFLFYPHARTEAQARVRWVLVFFVSMILPQVHLRKPCYDFSFL